MRGATLVPLAVALILSGCGRRSKQEIVSYERVGAKRLGGSAPPPPVRMLREPPLPPRVELDVPLPPPPASGEVPYVGSQEVSLDGYPARTADRVALLSLLRAGRFDDIEHAIETYQSAFEADYHKEYWPLDGLDAFDTADPRLDQPLDRWTQVSPGSFAAWAARGVHRAALNRFFKAVYEPSEQGRQQRGEVHRLDHLAIEDLEKAIALRPRLSAAYRKLLVISRRGEPKPERLLKDALKVCPRCFQTRVAYLVTLYPEHGGSLERMASFVREQPPDTTNPRLGLLPGYISAYRASRERNAGNLPAALAACDDALRLGDHWEFLYDCSLVKAKANDISGALRDLDRAVQLRPQVPHVLGYRAKIAAIAGRYEQAARDLLLSLQLWPAEIDLDDVSGIVSGLHEERNRLKRIGREDEAVRVTALAGQLDPSRQVSEPPEEPTRASVSLASIQDVPDSFQECQRREFTFAREKKFDAMVELWTAYLDRHPQEGRAYQRRATAYQWLGDNRRSRDDLEKACVLGVPGACNRRPGMNP